jgi:hypothetical protein
MFMGMKRPINLVTELQRRKARTSLKRKTAKTDATGCHNFDYLKDAPMPVWMKSGSSGGE